jgi:hypothetical protein
MECAAKTPLQITLQSVLTDYTGDTTVTMIIATTPIVMLAA